MFPPGRIVDEEQFGPALPIVEYTDIDAAVRRANSGMFGRGGSVWSADTEQAATVAQRLETGLSWVNTQTQAQRQATAQSVVPFPRRPLSLAL
jgi:acyl-CoA reductase-like NAD-dependent aldehyde dehydrogenase